MQSWGLIFIRQVIDLLPGIESYTRWLSRLSLGVSSLGVKARLAGYKLMQRTKLSEVSFESGYTCCCISFVLKADENYLYADAGSKRPD